MINIYFRDATVDILNKSFLQKIFTLNGSKCFEVTNKTAQEALLL